MFLVLPSVFLFVFGFVLVCLVLPSVFGFLPVAHLGGEGAGGVGGGQQGGVASGAGSLIRTHPAFTPFMCWKEAWEPTSRKLPKPRIPHI